MTAPERSGNGSDRMTLIEFPLFLLYMLMAASCVRWGLHRYGRRGAVGGLVFAFIILPLIIYGFGILASLIYSSLPDRQVQLFKLPASAFGQRPFCPLLRLRNALPQARPPPL